MTSGLDPRLAGVLHGLYCAVLGAAPLLGVPFALALSFFAAMPIFYVGFAKGPLAAVIAGVVAIVATSLVATPLGGLTLAANTVAPAAYAAFLINLARPAEELGGPSDGLAWFPLADVLLRLCLTVAMGSIVIGLAVGYDAADLRQVLIDGMNEADPSLREALGDDAQREALASLVSVLLPLAQPLSAVLVLVGNMHLAMRLARARGVLRRPPDDMALALRLPTLGLLAFGIALALSFGSGELAMAARAFAGALGAGFMIAGFAIVHWQLRGTTLRLPALIALYGLTALTTLPAFAMVAIGLFSSARAVPISKRTD